MSPDPFSKHMEAVAKFFWGEPNNRLSSATEMRFGNQGSRSVDLEKGVWADHEAGTGGGVLALVAQERHCRNGDAVRFLREDLGLDIPDDRPQRAGGDTRTDRKIVATYDYTDEEGALVFQVVRYNPKDFRQRRPDQTAVGGWNWSTKGVRQVPYRLGDVVEAIALEGTVFIVEGEKDANALWDAGIPATCNAGGAGKWPDGLAEHFRGADVVILPDNDDAGRNHAAIVGNALQGHASRVRTLDLPGLPLKGDVSDWMRSGGNAVELYIQLEQHAKDWAKAPPVSRFGAVLWSQMDRVTMRHDWLVEDMMFEGDFGLAYGASQSGKSFLAIDLGHAIARGTKFLGKETRQGSVIYQAGEGGKGVISRLRAYREHHNMRGEELPFVLLPGRVDLFTSAEDENGIEPFIEEILAWKAWLSDPLRMVVIDTWSTATPGANENASEDVSRALRNIQRIQDTSKAAVLVVHHKNAAGEKPRGHTSLYANADSALEVIRSEENPKERTLRIAKVKDGEDGEKIGFQLERVEIGTYDSGKERTSCVVSPAEVESPRAGKTRDRLPPQSYKFLKVLEDAIIHRGGELPPEERIPTNMRGVEWSQFRDLYVTIQGHGLTPEAVRQYLKRSGDDLFNRGAINKHDRWVWITDRGRQWL